LAVGGLNRESAMAHSHHPHTTLSQSEADTLSDIFDGFSTQDHGLDSSGAHVPAGIYPGAIPRFSFDLPTSAPDQLHDEDGDYDRPRSTSTGQVLTRATPLSDGGGFDAQIGRAITIDTLSGEELTDPPHHGDAFHSSALQRGDTLQLNPLLRGDTLQLNPLQRGDTVELSLLEQRDIEEGTDGAHENTRGWARPLDRADTVQMTQHLLLSGEGLAHLRELQNHGPSPSLGLQEQSATMLPLGTVEGQHGCSSAACSACAVQASHIAPSANMHVATTPSENASLTVGSTVPLPAILSTHPFRAPADSASVGCGKRGLEGPEGSDDDDCTQPPPSPTQDETPTTSRQGMSLRQHIEFCEVIAKNLGINSRRERDWNKLWNVFVNDCAWGGVFFNYNRNLFKQKAKLILHERRERVHLRYWNTLKACASPRDIAIHLLRDAGPVPDEWDFGVIAEYLFTRAQGREAGPGSILKWNPEARDDMIAKIRTLHLENNETFFQISLRFKKLVSRSEIELALLSSCTCDECAKWNVSCESSDPELLRLAWTRSRAEIVSHLLAEHEASPANVMALEASIRSSDLFPLNVFSKWSRKNILDFLSASHSEKSCSACLRGSKRPRRSSVANPDAADLSDISLDFVEANALEVSDDARGCYDYTDDESDGEYPEDCATPRAGADEAAGLVYGLDQLTM